MGKILYLIRVWSPGSRFQHWELFNRKKSWTNQKKKEKKLKIKIKLILHFFHKKPPNQVFSYLPFPCNTPKHPLTALPPPTVCPHPVSKLGHASQPTAHTFLSSSSFWTLIHLWSDSVRLALRGIQDFCTYRAVASRSGGGTTADRGVESGEDKGILRDEKTNGAVAEWFPREKDRRNERKKW